MAIGHHYSRWGDARVELHKQLLHLAIAREASHNVLLIARLACECGGCGHGDERCRWSKMLSQNFLFVIVRVEWLSLDWVGDGKVANNDNCGSEPYRFGCRMLYLVCKR